MNSSLRLGDRGEIAVSAGLLVFTTLSIAFLFGDIAELAASEHQSLGQLLGLTVFVMAILFLIFGNIVFQASRLGFLVRRRRHHLQPFETVVRENWVHADPIVILVPSYKEDARTVRQTLLSAALQHHPNARVALLLDDPPVPSDAESEHLLREALGIPAEIEELLAVPKGIISRHLICQPRPNLPAHDPLRLLLSTYDDLIKWFDNVAASTPITDHTDALFVRVVLRTHRDLLESRARQLATRLAHPDSIGWDEVERELRRLLAVFSTNISIFQRKRYHNLSHEPNKAANLNAYIDLLGTHIEEVEDEDGASLYRSEGPRSVYIPDATYVLTLDADSLLDPTYALRLESIMTAPQHNRVAVVQTPYSAVRSPSGVLEHVAGATTDIQYEIHQGFTFWNATFWVGANALLRKQALEDIRTEAHEEGLVVPRYIQDRTVIEDTESTLDLNRKGWTLLNYPERLAYSATPPDFGSLLIQRRRWANGGLLILPKAIRLLLESGLHWRALTAFLVRVHYLTSIATSTIALLILLFIPMGVELNSIWLPLTALPYFAIYWLGLVRLGYSHGDILRVYAFNMMLIPINLSGVLKSIQQAITGVRSPFGRTPKVANRTAAPRWAVVSLWGLLGWCSVAALWDLAAGRWQHALFAFVTALSLGYSIAVFVGMHESWEDVTSGNTPAWWDSARRRWANSGQQGQAPI